MTRRQEREAERIYAQVLLRCMRGMPARGPVGSAANLKRMVASGECRHKASLARSEYVATLRRAKG